MKTFNLVYCFYFKLFLQLKQTLLHTLLLFIPPLFYNLAYNYYFEITNYHLKIFLYVYVFTLIITLCMLCYVTPRKLTKVEKRRNKKLKKKYKKKSFVTYFCLTFLLLFFENIFFITETIVILCFHYPAFYNGILLLQISSRMVLLNKLLIEYLKLFLIKKFQSNETLDLINLRIKDNLSLNSQFIQINPSANIETLIQFVETIYGKNYTNIRFGPKSLISERVQKLLLWNDYQMHDNSEIEVILATLDGGAKKKKSVKPMIQCQGLCNQFFSKGYLCLCGYCQNCRTQILKCKCCHHNNRKRCLHCGKCPPCQKKMKKKCIYCYQNEDIRERDYNEKTSQNNFLQTQIPSPDNYDNNISNPPSEDIRERDYNEKNSQKNSFQTQIPSPDNFANNISNPPSTCCYPKFPILDYGEQTNFMHLTNSQWISFQCILFWNYCLRNNLKVYPTLTNTHFLKKKFENILSKQKIEDLWLNYKHNQISLVHFLPTSKLSAHELENNLCTNTSSANLTNQFINSLVNSIILFHTENNKKFSLTYVLEQIVFKLNQTHPSYVRESFFHPDLFRFAFEALKSSSEVLKIVQNDESLSLREKNAHVHQFLFSMLLNNPSQIKIHEFPEFFHISKYLIDASLTHIIDFKLGKVKTFKREPKPRKVFSDHTFELIQKFYETYSIPWEGKRTATRLLENGEKETHHVYFLPKPFIETYFYFRVHDDYGGECTDANGKKKIPGESLFRQKQPYWIKPHPDVRTGYCPLCMKMDAYVRTFQKIVKDNCDCKNVKCPTFMHENDCDRMFFSETKLCEQCTTCCCETCSECNSSKFLKPSTSEFMKFLNCNTHQIDNYDYPKIECIMNPKNCSCSSCRLTSFEDILEHFCPKLSENIDYQFDVKTKDWKKEEVKTTKKKPFEVWVLESKKQNVFDFLEDFKTFLNKNQGFIWHYHMHNLQRYHYNTMISNIQNGKYGDSVMMAVIDWAESYIIKDGPKLSGQQFYKNKKGQIHGLVEFSYFAGEFHSCSNFFFSDQNIRKDPANSVGDVKKLILDQLNENKNLKIVHVFSDGSTKEFLNRKMFGNLKKLSKELGITIIWNYFGNNHGKNLCDSEFARLKTKLDREFVDFLKENKKFTKDAGGIAEFCKNKLKMWSCNGNQVKERKFHVRPNNEEVFEDYKPLKDVKNYRCVMWDQNGNFYRKYNSCSCEACVVRPLDPTTPSKCTHKLSGTWKLETLYKNTTNTDQDSNISDDILMSSPSQESALETPDDNSDFEVMLGDDRDE
jgi:hypothetical protein